jgi:hypothetical protein
MGGENLPFEKLLRCVTQFFLLIVDVYLCFFWMFQYFLVVESLCSPQVLILTEVSLFFIELSERLPKSLVVCCLEDNGTFVANM